MNKEKALKAIKTGTFTACFLGIVNLAVTFYAIKSNATEGLLSYLNDPWIFFDVILCFILAFFIYKKSRIAAVTFFIYYIFSKIYVAVDLERMPGFLAIMFVYILWKTIKGTFDFHTIEKQENPNYKPTSILKACVIIFFIVIFLVLSLIVINALTA